MIPSEVTEFPPPTFYNSLRKLAALREEATALGIDWKAQWGCKRLAQVIADARRDSIDVDVECATDVVEPETGHIYAIKLPTYRSVKIGQTIHAPEQRAANVFNKYLDELARECTARGDKYPSRRELVRDYLSVSSVEIPRKHLTRLENFIHAVEYGSWLGGNLTEHYRRIPLPNNPTEFFRCAPDFADFFPEYARYLYAVMLQAEWDGPPLVMFMVEAEEALTHTGRSHDPVVEDCRQTLKKIFNKNYSGAADPNSFIVSGLIADFKTKTEELTHMSAELVTTRTHAPTPVVAGALLPDPIISGKFEVFEDGIIVIDGRAITVDRFLKLINYGPGVPA